MSDENTIPFHRIASQIYNRPLLVLPATAEVISSYLLGRMGGGRRGNSDAGKSTTFFRGTALGENAAEYHSSRVSSFYGSYASDNKGRPMPYPRTADGTAIITVDGELVNRGAWVGADSGLVSYEGIKYQLATALADPNTKNILLDLNTPGGEAIGAFEAAAAVREAAKVKDVFAVVNGIAASGGYALACGATRIITTETGITGSIGVVAMHLDFSKALEKEGIKPTLVFAGAHKADGNPFEPLPADVRDDFQASVLQTYDQFVATVMAGRPSLSDKQIRDTEARTYKGADAVKVGLADAVGTFEQVLSEMSRGTSRRIAQPSQTKGNTMDVKSGDPAANLAGNLDHSVAFSTITSIAALQLAFPSLCAQLTADAANAERTRILAIEAAALPGHDAIIAAHKADPSKTAGDAALAINAAVKANQAKQLGSLVTDEKKVESLKTEQPAADASGKAQIPAREIAAKAAEYHAEQQAKGNRISVSAAVAHVTAQLAG